MILGILFPETGSFRKLKKGGQEERFIQLYLTPYTKNFEKVFIYSYENEDTILPHNCVLIRNKKKLNWKIYMFLMPIINKRYYKKCDVFRVMQMTGIIPAIINKFFYRKSIVATYGYRYSELYKINGRYITSAIIKVIEYLGFIFCDKIIVTIPDTLNYVKKYVNRSKIVYIPNGVDVEKFKPCERKKSHNKSQDKNIIFVGRLEKVKNLFMLIDALSILNNKTKHKSKLILIGDGSLKESLILYSNKKKVRVEFKGIIPHLELPKYLQKADIFVLPSLSEGHSKVLIEAMACGLPCIGTKVKGISDIIEDGKTGLLCENNPIDLASKIQKVIENPRLAKKLGKNSRKQIQEHFNIHNLINKEIRILKNCSITSK